jgi:hypothetical protein
VENPIGQKTVHESRKEIRFTRSVHIIFYILLGLGLLTLSVSTNYATSYFWIVPLEPWPTHGDVWGARIYDGYYQWRDSAISLLVMASLCYLFLMWLDTRNTSKFQMNPGNRHLYASLLLPSMFTFGYPGGTFYNGPVGFSLTGIISPTYNYFFNGWSGATIVSANLLTPLLVPSVIVFVIGFLQIVGLILYERKWIGLGVFLVPVVTSLIFSVILLGSIFPASYFGPVYNPDFVEVIFSIPILTIGILIRALGFKNAKLANS